MTKRESPIPLYFTSLEIKNVRCFGADQRLDLTDENGLPVPWTLILGDNGVGKTTLLQCLAWMRPVPSDSAIGSQEEEDDSDEPQPLVKGKLGCALDIEENDILEGLLRLGPNAELTLSVKLSFRKVLRSYRENAESRATRGKTIGTRVQLLFTDKGRLRKQKYLRRSKIETLGGEFSEPLVVTYGANRLLGKQNLSKGELDDPIASRLSELTELYDMEEILGNLDYASLKKAKDSSEAKHLVRLKDALSKILPGDFEPDDLRIDPPDVLDQSSGPSGVRLKTYSGLVPLSALSLGYQTTLAWTADFAWRLLKHYPDSRDPLAEPAVVLIDEIDLHLHPLWQLRIVDDLCEVFSGTQFVATAHSPLMVQVAATANVVLLRKQDSGVEVVNDPEIVRSWRVDQILMSELFRVPRARDKQTEELFSRREELVDKPSRNASEDAELEELRDQIAKLPTAQDPGDQKRMDFIRETATALRRKRELKSDDPSNTT